MCYLPKSDASRIYQLHAVTVLLFPLQLIFMADSNVSGTCIWQQVVVYLANYTVNTDVAWAVQIGAHSVTSPNIRSIPFVPTGPVSLRMRKDGRYGEHDITTCPQVFSPRHAHRVLIRRHEAPVNSQLGCMWWTPNIADFERLPNSAYSDLGRCSHANILRIDHLGLMLKSRIQHISDNHQTSECDRLKDSYASSRHHILLLRFNSYTVREMIIGVAYTQRLYLETLSLADYIEYGFASKLDTDVTKISSPILHVLGATTVDTKTLHRLQVAGVPAYLVVANEDAMILGATSIGIAIPGTKDAIVMQEWQENNRTHPMPVIYSGAPSPSMHDIMTLPPHYDSLDNYFSGLTDTFHVVPIGKRGVVHVPIQDKSISKRKPKNTDTTGAYGDSYTFKH